MAYLTRGNINAHRENFKEAIDDFTRFMEENDKFTANLSPENLITHQKQKSDILIARSDCYIQSHIREYKEIRVYYDKLQKDVEVKFMKAQQELKQQQQQIQRQMQPNQPQQQIQQQKQQQKQQIKNNQKNDRDDDDDLSEPVDEAFMNDLLHRIKISLVSEFKNSFVDLCAARTLHLESKPLVDDQLRILKRIVNKYLRLY